MTKNKLEKDAPIPADVLDEETVYRGSIHFFSKGSARDVSMDFEFSHEFPDDYEGEAPAALKCLRDVGMSLMSSADRLEDIGLDHDALDALSMEDRQTAILEAYAKVQDEDMEPASDTKH